MPNKWLDFIIHPQILKTPPVVFNPGGGCGKKTIFLNTEKFGIIVFFIILHSFYIISLSHGVTGNTSDFGSEESRFEP